MTRYAAQVLTVLWKDLLLELRTGERIAAMTAFVVLVGVLFNFAVDRALVRPQSIAAGLIWMTIVFGGMLGLGRTFQMEDEEDAFEGVLASPIPRDALYLAKAATNFVLLAIVVALTLVIFGAFFSLSYGDQPLVLAAVFGLGTVGFVAVTTLFAAISHKTTMGETLLPILVFPLLVPVVIYGVSATNRIFAGRPIAETTGNIRMLGAFALVSITAGVILFRFAVEE